MDPAVEPHLPYAGRRPGRAGNRQRGPEAVGLVLVDLQRTAVDQVADDLSERDPDNDYTQSPTVAFKVPPSG